VTPPFPHLFHPLNLKQFHTWRDRSDGACICLLWGGLLLVRRPGRWPVHLATLTFARRLAQGGLNALKAQGPINPMKGIRE
jgi:hypothetical protein